ncbi:MULTISPECIES: GlxA family transcriptional regulator [unclassified Microbacterium]|uniref:GlxA family transcriptional regulator n=1 Tax=unclassified Microbacterium TaxID=2609290 RepID=UPI002167B5A4|nr:MULTISPECIES: helix-turn-helix domain-containing protein [unclassified Microbacterium]MCS3843283.1 transcriptional regulator GlxA family with amidase domain [Microbacterium sp. AK031]MDP3952751.1 helix-turn-helix domain-containing protein [Microbacterium sp.]
MKTVACIVQEGFAPFEFGVACEAFGLDRTDDGVPNFDFRVVTADPGAVTSKIGFSINVEDDLSFAYEADLVVVCPIPRTSWGATDERVLDVVRDADARGAWLLSICSGSFILAQAGVLDGRRATTHWMYADEMIAMFPQIDVDPDVLFVQDARIITSAGTAAGLDACLYLLRQEIGAELTNRIARRMVVPPQRDGGQAQYIDRPLPVAQTDSLVAVTDWAIGNLREELTVDQLATRAHMSPRTFARRFKAEHGATPAAWLARQRIIHAQRLLERSDLGLDAIAVECGFGSAAVLRQNFSRVLATTPTAYRAKFACADQPAA